MLLTKPIKPDKKYSKAAYKPYCYGQVNMRTVLVIDDEKPIVELLRLALTRSGYHVITAVGGREGIRMFDSEFVDIVITDVRMPGIDGQAVARHVRNSHRKSTPIVAISGTPWLFEGSDFDKVLAKPFPLKVLYDTVECLAGEHFEVAAAR